MPSRWGRRAFRQSIFHLCRQPGVARDFKIAGLTPRRMAPWHLQSLGQQSVYALAPFSTQASPPHDHGLPQPSEAPLVRSPPPSWGSCRNRRGRFRPRPPARANPVLVRSGCSLDQAESVDDTGPTLSCRSSLRLPVGNQDQCSRQALCTVISNSC